MPRKRAPATRNRPARRAQSLIDWKDSASNANVLDWRARAQQFGVVQQSQLKETDRQAQFAALLARAEQMNLDQPDIKLLDDHDFRDYKVAVKASDLFLAVSAYSQLAEAVDCPLHLGITEAGGLIGGTVKSAIGIGNLL